MKQKLEDLKSLEGYLESLESKYGSPALPSWANHGKKPNKQQEKEMKRVAKRIRELSYCERHTGKEGLDCYICKLEGKLNNL